MPLTNAVENFSMPASRPWTRRESRACSTSAGIAAIRPNLVVTSASEIPLAKLLMSELPEMRIWLKVVIIPVTVPSKPNKGEAAAVTAMKGRKRSRRGCASRIFFKRISSSSAFLERANSTALSNSGRKGPLTCSARSRAAGLCPDCTLASTSSRISGEDYESKRLPPP